MVSLMRDCLALQLAVQIRLKMVQREDPGHGRLSSKSRRAARRIEAPPQEAGFISRVLESSRWKSLVPTRYLLLHFIATAIRQSMKMRKSRKRFKGFKKFGDRVSLSIFVLHACWSLFHNTKTNCDGFFIFDFLVLVICANTNCERHGPCLSWREGDVEKGSGKWWRRFGEGGRGHDGVWGARAVGGKLRWWAR